MEGSKLAAAILGEVRRAVVGKDEVLAKVLLAILAGGHILLEDIPGVGKTTMALAFSKALSLRYNRVQFTPDVMPSDITGFTLYNKEAGRMEYQPGAVLCNLFLADELNRATSRTQSALLEAMEEGQVTVDGVSHPVPQPFLVIATQNPAGASGTQLLPDSQMDRFMVRLSIGYPAPADEMLADCPLPEEFVWCSVQEVRTVRPMAAAFAAITALQLHRWYKSRSFCGRCGAPTEPSRTERAMVCPKCGLIEYPKICPAVIVAVSDGERLLVSRYRDRPFRGWALIAGFVEIGETLEDTVRREVLEETGLRVKNLRYYKSQPWSFSDTLLAGFYCDLDGSDAIRIEEDELSEALWLPRGEIPPQGFVGLRKVVHAFAQRPDIQPRAAASV